MASKEFKGCNMMDFHRSWGGCMSGGPSKEVRRKNGLLLRLECYNLLLMGLKG